LFTLAREVTRFAYVTAVHVRHLEPLTIAGDSQARILIALIVGLVLLAGFLVIEAYTRVSFWLTATFGGL
jgi:uncharacterized protein (DUF983 family)